MEFRFPAAAEGFRQEVRAFLDQEAPSPQVGAEGDDERWRAYRAFLRKLGSRGWLALSWPREYGGGGRSTFEQAALLEELAYRRAPQPDMGITFVGPSIILHGTDEQKRRFLPPIARGEVSFCEGLSEPGAGSDLASLQTRAVRDGDDYVVNGQKTFTSGAHRADYIWLAARTDPEAPKHKGISCFVFPTDTPGVTRRPFPNIVDVLSFNDVYFENARIPKSALVGEENRGWYQIMTTLDFERAVFGAGVGMAAELRRSLDDLLSLVGPHPSLSQWERACPEPVEGARVRERALSLSKGRSQLKGPAPRLSGAARAKLAELAVEVQVARLLAYRIIWMQSRGLVPEAEVSQTKLFSSELTQRLAQAGMELLGLWGALRWGGATARPEPFDFAQDRPVEGRGAPSPAERERALSLSKGQGVTAPLGGRAAYAYLYNVSYTIGAGTSEVQRNIIAQRGLKLPRG